MQLSAKHPPTYRCLPYLTSCFMVLFLLPSIFFRKAIVLPLVGVIPVSVLLTGSYFLLLDIIAEVYGYYQAKKVLYAGLFAFVLYTIVTEVIISLPTSPGVFVKWSSIQDPNAYEYVFNHLYLFCIGVLLSGFLGSILNIVILSKWKIAVQGKYFWFRSVFSSSVAAIIYSFISMILALSPFLKEVTLAEIIKFVLISFGAKILTLSILSFPATILCLIIKKVEGIDVYDYHVDYNPF